MQVNNAPAFAAPVEKTPLPPQQMAQIKKSAEEFEAMFMSEMFNHMFSGNDVDPMFGGGKGEEIFRGLMVNEYGKMMSKTPSGIGLADQVQKAMIDMQVNANAAR